MREVVDLTVGDLPDEAIHWTGRMRAKAAGVSLRSVLSIDEKSQIQALDRTQPGLPMKKGRCATMTHDDKRDGTTTLFAALNVLEGKVIGRCMQHRHRFLNAIATAVPSGKTVHVILDNYATHKHGKVIAWLKRHPRFVFHFTLTSGPGSTPSKASSAS